MTRGYWGVVVRLLAALVGGGAATFASAEAVVSGTAMYRERIALTPEAVFEATIEDVSRADAPAEVVGRVRMHGPWQVPIRFEIPYDTTRIQAGNRYAVRARITEGGRLLFTTETAYPVITGGNPSEVQLLMKRPRGEAPAPLGALPATFRGALPCADCPGIEHQLDVYADGTFALRLVYQGRPESESVFDDIGRWSISQGRPALVLRGGREGTVQFALLEDGGLRKLDIEGQPIESDLNYTLARTEAFAPFEPRLTLRGMYSYMADAGVFRECLTGRALPVANEGDNAALERAYSDTRAGANEAVMVSVEGRIAERVPMEGPAGPTLVVDRFIGVHPGEHCPELVVDWSLTDTYWRLTQLNGAPVVVPEHGREPHIVLHAAESRVAGSGGCNRLMGGYVLDGEKLTFSKMASTMMACPEGMEQERAFAEALGKVRGWKLTGAQLEFYDEADKVVARFEATALK